VDGGINAFDLLLTLIIINPSLLIITSVSVHFNPSLINSLKWKSYNCSTEKSLKPSLNLSQIPTEPFQFFNGTS